MKVLVFLHHRTKLYKFNCTNWCVFFLKGHFEHFDVWLGLNVNIPAVVKANDFNSDRKDELTASLNLAP